jgi:hypothetical protein
LPVGRFLWKNGTVVRLENSAWKFKPELLPRSNGVASAIALKQLNAQGLFCLVYGSQIVVNFLA